MSRLVALRNGLPQILLCCTDCGRCWEPSWDQLSAGAECPWCECWSWKARLLPRDGARAMGRCS